MKKHSRKSWSTAAPPLTIWSTCSIQISWSSDLVGIDQHLLTSGHPIWAESSIKRRKKPICTRRWCFLINTTKSFAKTPSSSYTQITWCQSEATTITSRSNPKALNNKNYRLCRFKESLHRVFTRLLQIRLITKMPKPALSQQKNKRWLLTTFRLS